ncbi:hypothetical protein ABL78_6758 [Leptomonas seymouri]|uniref:Uncharacterized protein n=1 Tax=Leptomonas seymouri TaxID=5684 RepID=A0A0N1IIJ9_LEPSE|nr:hypothetical protein ABL78_6758 [Leptomonas seymouri]|eukprot:KPI84184.1 hypothetical protein ABL78_6758 [Leptomonas seymouri]
MLRYSLRRAAAATTGGFSSAAFTGDDGGSYNQLKAEQERLQQQHQGGEEAAQSGRSTPGSSGPISGDGDQRASSSSACSSSDFTSGSSHTTSSTAAASALERPTIDTYRTMTDEQLIDTLRLRDKQITQLRVIYETFHYDADKHFRKMIFDYHDKTMQLSQVHGKMQQASLQINREALARMRDEQDRMTRDKRLIFALCTLWTVVFWVWVRRHYVRKRELEWEPLSVIDLAQTSPAITGAGSYGNNLLSSSKRNARFVETSWEREVRERREAQEAQDRHWTLLRHQEEVEKAVAARNAEGVGAGAVTATKKAE